MQEDGQSDRRHVPLASDDADDRVAYSVMEYDKMKQSQYGWELWLCRENIS